MKTENVGKYLLYKKLKKATWKILSENGVKPKEGKEVGFELENEMSANQKYEINLFKRYDKMRRTTKQLDTIAALLEVAPSVCLSNQAKIKYSEYLEYNLENYFLRITSILDQSIIFVSDFYKLGLPPQSTSLRMLRENAHTKDKEAVNLIKAFDKALQPTKKVRNLIAHRGEFIDDDIMKIEANLYMLSQFGGELPDEPVIDDMVKLVDELIDKKISFVKNGVESVNKFLFALDHVLSSDEALV